ncbi:MAG: NfeD family protein [Clostridia bacterium]|nr:NfeD family protein [Clostridia bacterium]
MPAYMPYLWLGVVFCAAIAEAVSKRMIALSLVPGGVVASVLAFVGCPVWGQIPAFVVVSAGCGYLFFRLRPGRKGATRRNIGAEDLIGETGTVIEQIDNLAGCGLVLVNGEEWAARSVEYDGILDEGAQVSVVAVEGVRLICRPV